MNLMAPIPGMSLTKEPGNAPYEQPPLYNTPEEAIAFYLEKLNDQEKLDDIIYAMSEEVPIELLVDGMTSVGVMEGYHSVDVKILIMPILHEYLLTLAQAAGIKAVEELGPSKEERMQEREKKRLKLSLQKAFEGPIQVSQESVEEASEMVEEGGEMEPQPLVKRRKL